jgi:hypothetical protein
MAKDIAMKKLRIDRIYPDDLQSHFVSNIVVQHQADYFTLSFFEIWPPAIFGETEEEKQQALDAMEQVEAKCVARLVLTPAKMKEFVQVMSENLSNHEILTQSLSEHAEEE